MTDFDKYLEQLKNAGSGRQAQRVPKTTCPRFYGKRCFICDKVDNYLRLYNDDVSDQTKRQYLATLLELSTDSPEVKLPKNTWSAAKTHLKRQGFFPSERYYFNVVFPNDDPQTVVLLEGPPTIGQPLAKLQTGDNQDFKDFMHPIRGRNIYIEKAGSGRLANYTVQPRAQVSKLADMTVLKRMYNLDDIDQLLDDPNVKMTRPSRFEDDSTTEIRVLPNWSFIECSKDPEAKKKWEDFGYIAFLTTIRWHFGISPEEFDTYEKGDQLLPFDRKVQAAKAVETLTGDTKNPEDDVPMFMNKETENNTISEESLHAEPTEADNPEADLIGETPSEVIPCFGQYNEEDILCSVCDRTEECKKRFSKEG